MMARRRTQAPRVSCPCVADRYAAYNERIIELVHPETGAGCLVSVVATAGGVLEISVYRADKNVTVRS